MGGAIPLSEDEARDCAEGTFNPRLFPLLWAFYERKVRLDVMTAIKPEGSSPARARHAEASRPAPSWIW